MSIEHCPNCDKDIDTDLYAEHSIECSLEQYTKALRQFQKDNELIWQLLCDAVEKITETSESHKRLQEQIKNAIK